MFSTKAYIAYYNNENVLSESSSGGLFTALSDIILASGGVIVCSSFNYDERQLQYKIIENQLDRDLARGSVYVESDISDTFKRALKWLEMNPKKEMLIIGTGCQVDSFKQLVTMKGYSDRVYCVDLICHGVSSSIVFKDFLEDYIGIDDNNQINQIHFRSKRRKNGWRNPEAFVLVEGIEKSLRRYMQLYYSGCSFRECCYKCPYAKVIRNTDITIGDYWNPEKDDFVNEQGTSMAIVQSEQGMKLFEKAKEHIIFKEIELSKCNQPNLTKPTKEPEKKDRFWNAYFKKGITYAVNHIIVGTVFHRAWRKIMNV